jgi:precorrin-6B methylase 2
MTFTTTNRNLAWALVKIRIPVIYKTNGIFFYCNNALSMWRADTLCTKEPETIRWINTMTPGEVMADIGASTGLYSLYAAMRGITAYAFEPSPVVSEILLKNVHLNHTQFKNNEVCVCPVEGQAAHLVLEHVDHVKIDTDGSEIAVLKSNECIFEMAQSIMIEESTSTLDEIIQIFDRWGFDCTWRGVSLSMNYEQTNATKEWAWNALWVNE